MNYSIFSADTSEDAAIVQYDVLRKMSISDKAAITFQLSDNARALCLAGVKYRHPDYDDKSANYAVMKLMLCDELFRQVFGDIAVEP